MLRLQRRSAVWVSLALAALLTTVGRDARAQSEEIIEDPELAGQSSGSAAASGGEQVIADPELAADSGRSASGFGESAAPASELHFTLHVRGNRDLKEDDPREEVWEGTAALIL